MLLLKILPVILTSVIGDYIKMKKFPFLENKLYFHGNINYNVLIHFFIVFTFQLVVWLCANYNYLQLNFFIKFDDIPLYFYNIFCVFTDLIGSIQQ